MGYKITTLVENCVYGRKLQAEHGLSLYIETPENRLLFDAGASDLFIRNARLLHIDLQKEDYLASRFSTLSYLYLSPIFFASIGLKVVIPQMSATIVWFAVALTVVAILTKVVGCGLGAKLCKYSGRESLQIGVGMISRGEVALIVASKGEALGLMSEQLMGPVVIVVIITTIVAPILLKPVFHDKKEIKEKA